MPILTQKKRFLLAWLLVLFLLPALSFFGRALQHWVRGQIDSDELGLVFVLLTIGVLIIGFRSLRSLGSPTVFQISYIFLTSIIYLVLPLQLPLVEERAHFIIFGVFGFLSFKVFGLRLGLLLCILASTGDELFQWYLPDRVGDWADVRLNIFSAFAACFIGVGFSGDLRKWIRNMLY